MPERGVEGILSRNNSIDTLHRNRIKGFTGGSEVKTQIQSLIREDPTCHGAIKLVATTTEPML